MERRGTSDHGDIPANEVSETNPSEKSRQSGTTNSRDSFTWDNEFLTSFGVLDPEELSMITGGVKNSRSSILCATKKEKSSSTDSLATLESENLSLDSLEAELFEDIRASVKPFPKASSITDSRYKVAPVAANSKSSLALNFANSRCKEGVCSSIKSDIGSRKRMIPRPAPKMTSIGTQRSGKIMKQDSDYPKITQTTRVNSFSKPPIKAASSGSNRLKNEIQHIVTGSTSSRSKEACLSKLSYLVGQHLVVTKPARSLNSSVSSPKSHPTRFSSAVGTSVSASCGSSSKSHSIATRKIVDLRSVDQSKGGSSPQKIQDLTCMKKGPFNNRQNSGGNENRVAGKVVQNMKKASTQSVTVSSPSPPRSQTSSPKVFIFNGAKSIILTPMQSPSRSPLVSSRVGSAMDSPNRLFKTRSTREKDVKVIDYAKRWDSRMGLFGRRIKEWFPSIEL